MKDKKLNLVLARDEVKKLYQDYINIVSDWKDLFGRRVRELKLAQEQNPLQIPVKGSGEKLLRLEEAINIISIVCREMDVHLGVLRKRKSGLEHVRILKPVLPIWGHGTIEEIKTAISESHDKLEKRNQIFLSEEDKMKIDDLLKSFKVGDEFTGDQIIRVVCALKKTDIVCRETHNMWRQYIRDKMVGKVRTGNVKKERKTSTDLPQKTQVNVYTVLKEMA